ncbi:purine-cytosine permease family protein [Sphingobium subterraneum]|uniref:Purine-cytosine permease-like protein n=1 Tax=Sphingobium subterraneum TaxID=627688 RepID=A0A841J561_9SPHN|nr:hypothetical protein [Sphingobium subterraneum]MBB6123678.1 purine-cytosine permease-like protein [Sphingobium subterraneum]
MAGGSGNDEDYATSPVPFYGRGSWTTPFFAALGMATALIYMQLASVVTLQYGLVTAVLTVAYSTAASCGVAMVIACAAIRTGFGINLMARAVLGARGSVLFSLLFGFTTLVYFAVEANIMGAAIGEMTGGLALTFILPAVAIGMIPLVWFGMRFLGKFQAMTLIVYVVLLGAALVLSLKGAAPSAAGVAAMGASPLSLIGAIGIMNGLVFVTALVTADFARFVRQDIVKAGTVWMGGVFQLVAFGVSGVMGIWFALRYQVANPGVYLVTALGGGGALLALATQLRINLANMYLGSIAFTNAVEEMTPLRPPRHLMVVIFGVVAALVLLLHATHMIEAALNVIGLFSLCFTVLILVDILVVRREKWRNAGDSAFTQFAAWRWPAILSLLISSLLGNMTLWGTFGPSIVPAASIIAGVLQAALYVALSHRVPTRSNVTAV